MEFKDLFAALCKTYQSIIDGWLFKSAISILVGISASLHFSVGCAFVALIFIDLFTKWLALSSKYLNDKGFQDFDLSLCFMNIWNAYKAGYINSDAMKHRFCGKILWYLIITMTAIKTDAMIGASGESRLFLNSAWVYLALTEASSILENLRDAGVQQAGDLLAFIKGRIGVLLERYKLK